MVDKQSILTDAVYTTPEAASLLGVNSRILSQKIYRGEIKCKRYGRKYLVLGEYLLDYLKSDSLKNQK